MLDRPGRLTVQGWAQSPYMPDMDSSDWAPPEYRLVQPTSKAHTQDEVPLGSFFCEQKNEFTEQLNLVILRVQRTRTLWVSSDMNAPACSSDDRVTPKPGGMYPGPCATCEAAKGDCLPGYNVFCVEYAPGQKLNPENLFLLRVNGSSVFPFRKLWSKIHMNHQDNPWAIALSLTSAVKTNDKGTFWIMQPEIVEVFALGNPIRNNLKYIADELAGLAQEATQTQKSDTQSQSAAPPPPIASRRVQQVDRKALHDLMNLTQQLGAPPETVSTFIKDTFSKGRASELHAGEMEMLMKWLVQEFSSKQEEPQDWHDMPVEDFPF